MMIGRALKELDPLINADMLSAALGIEKRDAKNMLKDRYLWTYRDVEAAANLAGVNVERLVNYATTLQRTWWEELDLKMWMLYRRLYFWWFIERNF